MIAVSNTLKQTIKELQALPGLSNFALAGGTNLALRYNHRISEDIDLFCNTIIDPLSIRFHKNGLNKSVCSAGNSACPSINN